MVRPKAAVDRPKVCPQGHSDGTVYLHGERVGRDSRYGRPRFQCVRGTGKTALRHYWTSPHRAPTTKHPDGTLCTNCEHELVRGEGPSVVPWFEFAVAEVARELVLVGEGTSLRESSQKLRMLGGRYRTDSHGRRDASRDYALAADYLDNFGPIVVRGMTPVRWPRILVLDSQPLGIRVRDAHLYGYERNRRGGAVLIAAGRERNQARTRNWLATLAGDDTADSWFDFLSQLEGDRPPFWVVADGSKAIRNAVEALWPKAHFYPCEHHLRENALEHAKNDGALGEPGMEQAIQQAFYGVEAWDHLGTLVKGLGPSLIWGWWLRLDPDVRRMLDLKHRFGDYPNSNGPAERVALAIKDRIGERRRVFRNAERLATVIALMGIDIAEQASESRYVRVLRAELAKSGWTPELSWEGPHDYAGETASLDDLIIAAWDRAKAAEADDLRDAQTSSVERKVATINILRLAAGADPLQAVVGQGRSVASVSVAGKRLGDFPEILAEWDWDLNPDVADPASLTASANVRPYWKCAAGHGWRAWMSDRTKRLTRCRKCHRNWADDTNSIAVVHPELVAEWDPQNYPRSPEKTKATSKVVASWLCRDHPGAHPPYPMSPFGRRSWVGRGKPGCPECRKGLTKNAQRSPRRKGVSPTAGPSATGVGTPGSARS